MLTEETLNASAVPAGERHVLKTDNTFSLVDSFGDIFDLARSELGLYFRGTRHLSRMAFAVDGVLLLPLGSGIGAEGELIQEAMNERFAGVLSMPRGVLHFRRTTQQIEGAWSQRIEITNFAPAAIVLVLRWHVAADFLDLFEVRGARRVDRGHFLPTLIDDGALTFSYEGLDSIVRRTHVATRPAATSDGKQQFALEVEIQPGTCRYVDLSVTCQQVPASAPELDVPPTPPDVLEMLALRRAAQQARELRSAHIAVTDGFFARWFEQSWTDLRAMTVDTEHGSIIHAGVPWFSTLFGRDALWTALSVGWLQPELSRGVLLALAESQALEWDARRDAEPGKIIHEVREGEMANLFEVPFGRYYGSVDSTPLFLVLLGDYLRATDDVDTVHRLLPAAKRALRWLREFGDRDGDGFIEYQRHSPEGLLQQGWKDSHDSIFHDSGMPAPGPIALSEVQGYAYAAHLSLAEVLRRLGDPNGAEELVGDAEALRLRFDEAFWCDEIGMYALALDGDKRPCRVRSSNVGHVLWSGIALPTRYARVARSLGERDLRSGWGLRTISSEAKNYNPLSYHNGSVWPHDTAIAIAGLSRIGAWQEALSLFDELAHLARRVARCRLPELICGFSRGPDDRPTVYPVACSPQAWASAACYLGLRALLGVELDAAAGVVRFRAPRLPSSLDTLRILRLPLGRRRVDIDVRRDGEQFHVTTADSQSEPR